MADGLLARGKLVCRSIAKVRPLPLKPFEYKLKLTDWACLIPLSGGKPPLGWRYRGLDALFAGRYSLRVAATSVVQTGLWRLEKPSGSVELKIECLKRRENFVCLGGIGQTEV